MLFIFESGDFMYFYNSFMFDIFPFIFGVIFFVILGSIIIKGISEWSNNNKQPILDVNCKVVSRRFKVSGTSVHTGYDDIHHSGNTSTTYYITFEVESGDRIEFRVSNKDYGMIAENDTGRLTFQGTRFLGFNRII